MFNENVRHPEYSEYEPLWQKIVDLMDPFLMDKNKRSYIVPRLKEDPEVYNHRLEKFTYTPVMARAIMDLIKRLNTAVIEVNYKQDEFLDNIAPMKVANLIMRDWLSFGRTIWVFNNGGISNILPTTLVNWRVNDEDGLLDWAVLKYEKEKITLEDHPESYQQYIVIERDVIKEYDNSKGGMSLVEETANESGYVPVIISRCPNHLWTAKSAYLKQIQHLLVENGMTDASTNMYVQRVIKPTLIPDDDLGNTYVDQEQGPSSNSHIINGDFSFSEPSGSSVSTNLTLLDFIEKQVRALISMANVEGQSNRESGESKMYDFREVSMVLEEYGHHIRIFIRELYEWILAITGASSQDVEISGLDTFEVDTLDNLLNVATIVSGLEGIPADGKEYLYRRISEKLKGGVNDV